MSNKLEISSSPRFPEWLHAQQVSLALTTYQTHRLFLMGLGPEGRMAGFERLFDRPMGLHATPERLLMAERYQIRELVNALSDGDTYEGRDRVYVPRRTWTTGELDVHDLHRTADGGIVFVNTQFSCLAAPSETHSFRPVWAPPFISQLSPEDRCHLNGLAMKDGRPRYVTAVSRSDVAAGWRDRREDGGVVIDVAHDAVVASGLSMPHSPRLHRGALYLINAGTGELGRIDTDSGRFEPVAFCPGYGRGLAFVDHFAVVGLSKPRRNRAFQGLPLDERLDAKDASARCGLFVIDLDTGATAHWMEFEAVVEELYDVQVLPGVRRPMALGLKTDEIRRFITLETDDGGTERFLLTLDEPAASDALGGGEPLGLMPSFELPDGATRSARRSAEQPYGWHAGRMPVAKIADQFDPFLPARVKRRMESGVLSGDAPMLVVAAAHEQTPAGFAFADARPAAGTATLHGLRVLPAHRRQGLGAELLARTEHLLAQAGIPTVQAGYRGNLPGRAALERVFEKRGWGAPRVAQHLYKGSPASMLLQLSSLAEARLPEGTTCFSWRDLSNAERKALRTRLDAGEIPGSVSPFQMEPSVDLSCSVGLRRDDASGARAVAGWMVTHRLGPDLVQYTALYVDDALRRRQAGLALVAAAARRHRDDTEASTGLWTVDAGNDAMKAFVEAHLRDGLTSSTERLLVGKRLS